MSAWRENSESCSNFNLRLAGFAVLRALAFHVRTEWLKTLRSAKLLVWNRSRGLCFDVNVNRVKSFFLGHNVVPFKDRWAVPLWAEHFREQLFIDADGDASV